jgi:hypothetical protein
MTQQKREDNFSPEKEVGSLQEIARKAASDCAQRLLPLFSMDTKYYRDKNEKDIYSFILRALQSVAQPLEEKNQRSKRDLDWTRDNATEHCHRADTAEAAVGANCRTISALQASAQTLKEKANKSERALLRIYDWARDNEPLQTKIKRNTLLQDICEEGLGYWPGSSDFPLQARIKELEAEK